MKVKYIDKSSRKANENLNGEVTADAMIIVSREYELMLKESTDGNVVSITGVKEAKSYLKSFVDAMHGKIDM